MSRNPRQRQGSGMVDRRQPLFFARLRVVPTHPSLPPLDDWGLDLLRRFATWLVAAALWFGAAGSALVSPAAIAAQLFSLADFAFEDGSVLPDMHIAYDTQGTLSPARDNAILLLPGAINDRHVFDPVIGPDKTFDTNRFFIVTADPLGGGESTSPGDGMGQDFPRYTIRDMMEAAQALVTKGLGITRLRAVVGMSMGSFVALEWGIHHPDSAGGLVLMAPSPQSDAAFRLTLDMASATIALDPEWQGGRYTHNPVEGLRHAGMQFYPWVVSTAHLDGLTPEALAQELEAAAGAFAAWDANALVLRQAAYRAHDVAAPFDGDLAKALAAVTMPVLLLANPGDRLVDIAGARALRDGVKQAVYAEIPGDLGHRSVRALPGSPAGDFIDRRIRAFLSALPGVPAD